MRCLVTGGTGFIGSNLALELRNRGLKVIVTGNESEQGLPDDIECFYPGLYGIDWDNIGRIDVLFHQAAMNKTTNPVRAEMMFANYISSVRLFDWAVASGCRRIVYASSTAVYGDVPPPYKESGPVNPLNPYAESKLLLDNHVEGLVRRHPGVKIVGLRYCNVYGPGENHKGKRATMIYQLAQQMRTGRPVLFAVGEQKRDYIHVKDVVQANILASEAEESCIVNCGSGAATTFNEVVRILNRVMGTKRDPFYIDNPYKGGYQSHTECDMSLAKEKLGFVPEYDIENGVRDYYDSGFLVKR